MPSTAFLRASLKRWQWRHAFRQRRLDAAHQRDDTKAITKWYRLLEDAGEMVARRRRQLANRKRTPRRGHEVWYSKAQRVIRENAGPFIAGAKPKGLLHTTEGHGDATSTLDAKRAWPHFEVLENGRVIQYIPIDRASRALEHPPGTVETNRAHVIQIEISGLAASINSMGNRQRDALKALMRWIETNAGVRRESTVKFVGRGKTNHLAPVQWLAYDGWLGHQHVPNNAHWDPGALRIGELL